MLLRTLTGERLVDIAASYVKRFVERHQPHRIYLFVSGGKDSTAAAAAVAYSGDSVMKRVVVVYNEVAGNTHPWNVEQAYRVLRKLGFEEPTVIESPPYNRITGAVFRGVRSIHVRALSRRRRDFWDAVQVWGIPVLRPEGKFGRRWCYNEFKEKHWRALPPEPHNGHLARFIVVGVKATDSHWRKHRWLTGNPDAHRWERIFEWRDGRNHILDYAVSPILKLDNDHVWALLEEAGLKKELRTYQLCGDSLNCTLCPLRSRDKQQKIIECVAGTPEGRELLMRALKALKRAKPDTLTSQKAKEWIELIEATGIRVE